MTAAVRKRASGATVTTMPAVEGNRAISCALVVLGGALSVVPLNIALTESSVVGGVSALILCWTLAWATWPVAPSPEELAHRELESIWQQMRPVYDADARHSLWAAWASASADAVELSLLERRPSAGPVVQGAPSPYVRHAMTSVDPDDVEEAAAAMERLRDEAVECEERGRLAFLAQERAVEQQAHRDALDEIDRRTRAYAKAQDATLEAETAAQRAAQAEAVARAIRKP